MANLKTMYKGVVNSPETYLKEVLTQGATVMYVADGSVFGTLPTLATIGDSENAETILVKSKRSDGGYDIQRGFEGTDKKWDKATVVARNFTNYDYQTLVDNTNTLNTSKVDKVSGKNLSTNDFTTAYKNKLNNLSSTASGNEATTSNRGYMSAADKKKLDGIDLSKYAETGLVNALEQEIRAIGEITTQKADKTDIKTKLSDLTDDNTHRTVTDSEKSTWNSKLSSVSGQDVSRAKTKGYSSASSWTSVGSSRDVEDWIGDFDKRTRENKTAISGKVNQSDITDMKKCKILTQSEYDALSSTEKNRADTLYFIKE
uniref:Uncharacterized protein n=1 Tax=Firmicutes phage HS18 TaxID=3056396 RepID=A0AA49X915_9VIRU|nr:MAG: hypothetical protein [Firmicutes phage HS18]